MVLNMERWVGKVAIVTGASAGIGVAIVDQLVDQGLKVVGLARRKDRLDALEKKHANKKGKFYGVQTDLSKEEDILQAFKWTLDNVGPVHILVNNAGLIQSTSLTDGDTEMWKKTLDVNILGLCIATREAVRIMKANEIAGHIIHINSIAGHQVPNFPMTNVYPASKHAVTALTETLRFEINSQGLKIKITSISPGLVKSEIFEASGVEAATLDLIETMPILQAEDIADGVVYVLSTPPHVQVHELMIKPVNEAF